MQFLVTIAAIWAVTGAAPTGKSWGIPASLAPQRISYNYVPYYQAPHLARILSPAPAPIVIPYRPGSSYRYHVQDEFGQYNYGYANADGQAKTEIRGIDGSVAGKFSYFDPEGKHIELSYVADKDGFRASGDHLPKPVELPEDLAEAYEEAKERINQVRAATAAKRAYKAAATAAQRYSQSRIQAYSQQAYPQVYPQTFVQAVPKTYVRAAPYQTYTPTRTYVQPVPATVTYVRPAAQTTTTYVQAVPQQTYTPVQVDTSSSEDGDDGQDDGQDDGKYNYEVHEKDDDDHDDGEYREGDHGHEAGQYKHDDKGDDNDDGDDEDKDDEDGGDDKGDDESQVYSTGVAGITGVVATAPGQVYVSTPVQTTGVSAQGIYTAPVTTGVYSAPAVSTAQKVYTAPVSTGFSGYGVSGYTAAQAQPSVGIIRQPVYTAPSLVSASTQTVYRQHGYYSAPAASASGYYSAPASSAMGYYSAPAASTAGYYSAPAPAQATLGVYRPNAYTAPPQIRAPVSYLRPAYTISAPAPVHAPVPVHAAASSPVVATKVKSYTATGPVRSLPVIQHSGTTGVTSQLTHGTGGISTYSVSAQIPVRSVPVAAPQVTVPVYSATTGQKFHSGTGGPISTVSVLPAASQTVYRPVATVAASAPAPAPHAKSGYSYTG